MNINGKVKVYPVNGVPFIATITQNNWGRYSSQYSGSMLAEVMKLRVPKLAISTAQLKEGVTIDDKFYHVMKMEQKGINYNIWLSDNSEIELNDVVRTGGV